MATVQGLTAERTLEVLASKAPVDGTPRMIVYDGIAWPTDRQGASNIMWLDTSGTAPIPSAFDSATDVLLQPGVA